MKINRVNALCFVLMLLGVALLAFTGMPARAQDGAALKQSTISAKDKSTPLVLLIDAVRTQGPASTLPPHLSEVLKLTEGGQSTPVKQALMRDGDRVHTFNVRSDGHDDVVLMVFDTRTQATRAYLTGEAGKLRKAVSYQAGEAPTERSIQDARADFNAEVAYWSTLSRKPAPGH
jgi:hypothetical protein